MRPVLVAGLSLASLGLVACGGGGGGGEAPGGGVVTPPTPPVTFTKWSDKLKAGAAVVVSGKALEFTDTYAGGVHTYTPALASDASVTQTLGATGETTALKLVAGGRTLEFAAANGDTFTPAAYDAALTVAKAKDGGRLAVSADPLKFGWNYQSFSIWRNGYVGFSSGGDAGSFSIGETTVASAIPTTTTAVFRGRAVASYVSGVALASTLEAAVTLTANFAGRSARLTSSSFTDVDYGWGSLGGGGLEGTLTYAAGTNALSGPVTLTGFGMTGTASAQFYGPAADEVGGQFILQPTDPAAGRLIGAFGAAKTATTPGAAFVNWATSRQPGATNSLQGQALTIAVTGGGAPATALAAPTTGDAIFSETLNAAGAPANLAVTAGNRTVTFSTAAGDTVTRGRVIQAAALDKSATALFSDPTLMGLDYQSFGVWQSGLGGATGVIGAQSTGLATAGAAIPTSGSAIFRGDATLLRTSDGYSNSYTSSMTLTANFAARTADLTIFGVPLGGGASLPGVTGSLSYTAATNQLSGTATSGALTGTATARFFGPAAEEVGGMFSLSRSGDPASLDRLIGAFGGRR